VDVAKAWSRRVDSYDLKLDGDEHAQLVRNLVFGTGSDSGDTHEDDDGPHSYILFEPIEGPIAAPGGGKGNNRGGGSAPTDITISSDNVDENSAGGTVVGTFGAADADNRERHTFTLLDDAGGMFAISGKDKLVVADGANLDYETTTSYQITVLVTDKKGLTYQEVMTISVNDVVETPNTAPTDITLTSQSIDENSSGGTVVGTLGNDDPDAGDSWTYVITSDPDQKFDIVNGQLVLQSGATLDYETAQSHSVTIQVTDSAGASHSEIFTINVNDLVEPVNTAPTDITLSNASIAEDSSSGTVIGTLGNDDPDAGDSWTYVITSDPDQKFDIVNGQLVLQSGATLDFETAQSHSVTVQVTDSAGASHSEVFNISVTDVVEPPTTGPTDQQLSGSSVQEGVDNGTLVGVVTATDPDAGETFRYTLIDSADGRFTLNGDQLQVSNISMLDYESQTSHDVTIRVTDSDGNSYDETFSIQVQDVAGSLPEQPNYVQALIPAVGGEASRVWPDGNTGTAPTTITFAILTDFPSYYDPANLPYTNYTSGAVPFDQLTNAQLTVIYQLLDEVEEIANVEFVQVNSGEEANITFGMYYQDSGIGAYAYYPSGSGSTGTLAGDIWLNSRYDTSPTTNDSVGADWARATIAHELGHALGLKHPGDYNAGGGGTPGPFLDAEVDNNRYTTMSYNDFPSSSADPADYMLYDVATLQYLYGANTSHATGDDVYLFNTSSNLIDTIWDAGGFDTISAAGANSAVTIDLRQGEFSSIGLTQNIAIAWGADIEAAIGGNGGDTLIGNVLDNTFTGNGGADIFVFDDDWGTDVILDFQNGLDLIDLSATGLIFDDLSIGNGGSGAEISGGGATVILSGIDASVIDDTDFVFV
jgi:hypothetical protein